MRRAKYGDTLWAVELDISAEANRPEGTYWVVHVELGDDNEQHPCVFFDRKDAVERAKGCDHRARVIAYGPKNGGKP